MIIYNVTIKVEGKIAEAWLHWLLDEHIPDVIQTNCFIDYKLFDIFPLHSRHGTAKIYNQRNHNFKEQR